MKTDPLFDIGMPFFYGEIMRAWRLSGARLEIIHDSVSHVLNLPIDISLIQIAISAPSKVLYNVINANLNSHLSNETSHWHGNGVLNTNTNIQWSSIYSPPNF